MDGVVAVVGKNIVLHGEVLQQAQLFALEQKIDPTKSPYLFESIYSTTLDNIINQYVLLDHAQKDTNIVISSSEVDRVLEEKIQTFIQQAGSKERFESLVGMPLRKIRAEYWKEINNMMYIEKYKSLKMQYIDISRVEIIDFYTQFKDSISIIPEKYTFSIIEVPVVAGSKSEKEAAFFLDSLRSLLVFDYISFDSLAKKHSKDPGSASSGGRLGYTSRGSLVQQYEKTAYSLKVGEISNPIKSDFGYHLIKLLDRRGEKISSQHILLTINSLKEDYDVAFKNIEKISIQTNNDPFVFDSIATEFAHSYNNYSGVYKSVQKENIPLILFDFITKSFPYVISDPIQLNESFVLILLYKHEKS